MKIHFIGIGGIGVSALARYYLEKGNKISGSDLVSSEITKSLEELGVQIFTGPHKATCLTSDVKQVIYSAAVQKSNPELKRAKELGIKIQTYPQALGKLTKKHFTIAISGAHGKGTTTAMISLILIKAGFDPTVIIGTKMRELGDSTHSKNSGLILSYAKGSNCRVGKSKYLIIEADEYESAFLNYWPRIIVVTNIDKEHLDYYRDLNHIIETFSEFISHLPQNGILIANKDNNNILRMLKSKVPTPQGCGADASQKSKVQFKIQKYSSTQKEADRLKKILKIPGQHNVSNALAALSVARILKIPDETSFQALSEYEGAWRRFETYQSKWGLKRITIVSDYAHHPSEISSTLQAARQKFPKRRIWAVFQPHQYQRTYYLFDEFINAFDKADKIIITEIYSVAGRERKDIVKRINAKSLAQEMRKKRKNVYFIKDLNKIPQFLRAKVEHQDVVLVMGAGSIYKIVENLV